MNAQVGLCRPGDIGADVCHLNLHKTFCIPHGGGGPGMGPIGVARTWFRFSRSSCRRDRAGRRPSVRFRRRPVAAPSILPIPWVYIALMGRDGLTEATQGRDPECQLHGQAVGERLSRFSTRGKAGWWRTNAFSTCANSKRRREWRSMDVAKRLMDYGFHAPTVSLPVAGTLMIEPTESESKAELDRFCDAMIAHPRGNPGDHRRTSAPRQQCAEERSPYGPDGRCFRMGSSVQPGAGRVSCALGEGTQVLAPCRPDRRSVRRSQSDLHLPSCGTLLDLARHLAAHRFRR